MCVSRSGKTLEVVRSIGSVVPLLWSRCQLCREELSDHLLTSHSDAQWRAQEEGGQLTPYLLTTLAHCYFFLSFFVSVLLFVFLSTSSHTCFSLRSPPPLPSLSQAQTSPQSLCPSPPSWWVTSMTLWCCLRLVCPTGRNCCWIPLAPSGTSGTWWFVLTTRPCSVAPRASSETSQLSTR